MAPIDLGWSLITRSVLLLADLVTYVQGKVEVAHGNNKERIGICYAIQQIEKRKVLELI